jgi:hypothetical protein
MGQLDNIFNNFLKTIIAFYRSAYPREQVGI